MNELVIPGAVLAVALVAALAWRGWRSSRGAQLRRIARTLGLERAADPSVVASAPPLRLPPLGDRGARTLGAWRGELLGAELWAIELQRDGAAAPDPLLLVRDTSTPLPTFTLAPRGEGTGEPGLRFTARDRFGELFTLRGGDEEAVRRVFRDEVLGFFERSENLSWLLLSAEDWLAIAVSPLGERSRRLDPKHFAGFVEDAKVVYRVLRGAPPRPRIGKGA